jgi:quercetin dioxygenase-like cupin family protein
MSTGEYDSTSGSDTRESRALMGRLLVFDLHAEIRRLRSEEQWTDGDRNSVTLAKDVDFRVLLTVLRRGVTIDETDGDARASIQLISGEATLEADGRSIRLSSGQLAALDQGVAWNLSATEDSALLLTLAWPRDKAGA